MPTTKLADVADQVQKIWSPVFGKQLRENSMLPSLVNKEYQGDIRKLNDTVYVSQINAPEGSLRTVGVDADSFASEKLQTQRISIVADKRATASFEFEELVDIQSQIGAEKSAIREALLFSLMRQVNDHCYSKVNPSTANPDHLITGVADFNATQLNSGAKLASQAFWPDSAPKYCLVDASYASDLRAAQTLTSSDFVGDDRVVVAGKVATPRFGFQILEDNSRGLRTLSATVGGGEDAALLFTPDFLHLVMQSDVEIKIAELTANKQFGYVIVANLILGAALGIDGDDKHIVYKA